MPRLLTNIKTRYSKSSQYYYVSKLLCAPKILLFIVLMIICCIQIILYYCNMGCCCASSSTAVIVIPVTSVTSATTNRTSPVNHGPSANAAIDVTNETVDEHVMDNTSRRCPPEPETVFISTESCDVRCRSESSMLLTSRDIAVTDRYTHLATPDKPVDRCIETYNVTLGQLTVIRVRSCSSFSPSISIASSNDRWLNYASESSSISGSDSVIDLVSFNSSVTSHHDVIKHRPKAAIVGRRTLHDESW